MRFKVPQNVQREDQILWFLTLRQVILLVVGFGISYTLFNGLSKQYELNELEIILCWLPAAIAAIFAFIKIHGIGLFKFVLLQIEQAAFRQPRRRWIRHAGEPFVSMTVPFTMKTTQKQLQSEARQEDFSTQKVRSLAKLLDSEGIPDTPPIK